jgi:hypothetical protein
VTVMLSLGPADYRDVAFCEARGDRRSGSARIIMLCTRTDAVCGSTHPRCIDGLSFAVPTVQIQQFTACRSHNLARHHVRAGPNKKPATDAEPQNPLSHTSLRTLGGQASSPLGICGGRRNTQKRDRQGLGPPAVATSFHWTLWADQPTLLSRRLWAESGPISPDQSRFNTCV